MDTKIKILILSSCLFYLFGSGYLFITNLSKKADIPKGPSIEATTTLSSSIVKTIQNISDRNPNNMVILTTKVTNNTSGTLTGIKLIIPHDEYLITVETASAKRLTNLPGQGSDAVFSLPDLSSKTSTQSLVLLYALKKGIYTIKPYIETNEKYKVTVDAITLSAL